MSYKREITKVPLERIFVDGELQRPEQKRHTEQIAGEWDDLLFQIPTLSARDNGYYHAIDGQHTIKALRSLGVPEVDALVFHGLTRAEEARGFVRRNGQRKAVKNIDKFNVSVVGEDELAVPVNDILVGWKWTVGSNAFAAVVTLQRVARGSKGLVSASNVIETITRAWGNDVAGAHQNIIAGLGSLYNKRDIDVERMVRQLGLVSPLAIRRDAGALTVGTAPVRYANVMLRHYNKGLRDANRIPELVRA